MSDIIRKFYETFETKEKNGFSISGTGSTIQTQKDDEDKVYFTISTIQTQKNDEVYLTKLNVNTTITGSNNNIFKSLKVFGRTRRKETESSEEKTVLFYRTNFKLNPETLVSLEPMEKIEISNLFVGSPTESGIKEINGGVLNFEKSLFHNENYNENTDVKDNILYLNNNDIYLESTKTKFKFKTGSENITYISKGDSSVNLFDFETIKEKSDIPFIITESLTLDNLGFFATEEDHVPFLASTTEENQQLISTLGLEDIEEDIEGKKIPILCHKYHHSEISEGEESEEHESLFKLKYENDKYILYLNNGDNYFLETDEADANIEHDPLFLFGDYKVFGITFKENSDAKSINFIPDNRDGKMHLIIEVNEIRAF